MKRGFALIAVALLAPACVAALGGVMSADSPVVVAPEVAETLYGGACGNASITGQCSGSYKGCELTKGERILSIDGSWKVTDSPYCGVEECGDVDTTAECDS